MTTLAQFWSAVSNRVGNLDSAVSADQARMTLWANEAVLEILKRTGVYVTTTTITPAASSYTLTSSVLDIIDLYATSSGTDYPVERVSVDDLLDMRRNNTSASSPTNYYALAGANLLLFYPTPAAADTFTLYYVPSPTALSASSDTPSASANGGIPAEYHKAIEFYMQAEAADDDDDQSSAQGQRYRDLFEKWIVRIRAETRGKAGPYNPRARVGNRRGGRHDNSVYP